MPVNVFGNSSTNYENKNDTSHFVQKPYLRTIYLEANIEENFHLESLFRIENLADPINIREAVSKNYVNNKYNDPILIKDTAHVELKAKNLDNVRFFKVNSMTAV